MTGALGRRARSQDLFFGTQRHGPEPDPACTRAARSCHAAASATGLDPGACAASRRTSSTRLLTERREPGGDRPATASCATENIVGLNLRNVNTRRRTSTSTSTARPTSTATRTAIVDLETYASMNIGQRRSTSTRDDPNSYLCPCDERRSTAIPTSTRLFDAPHDALLDARPSSASSPAVPYFHDHVASSLRNLLDPEIADRLTRSTAARRYLAGARPRSRREEVLQRVPRRPRSRFLVPSSSKVQIDAAAARTRTTTSRRSWPTSESL